MPNQGIDITDAQEISETLQLITDWIASDPDELNTSLTRYIGVNAYGATQLTDDLNRFIFLLGGDIHSEDRFTPKQT